MQAYIYSGLSEIISGKVTDQSPSLFKLKTSFCQAPLSTFPFLRMAMACWLSSEFTLQCFLNRFCKICPPIYCSPAFCLSFSSAAMLFVVVCFYGYQNSMILSATFIGSNVAAFCVSPLKYLGAFAALSL